jgi:hypothetical protein
MVKMCSLRLLIIVIILVKIMESTTRPLEYLLRQHASRKHASRKPIIYFQRKLLKQMYYISFLFKQILNILKSSLSVAYKQTTILVQSTKNRKCTENDKLVPYKYDVTFLQGFLKETMAS